LGAGPINRLFDGTPCYQSAGLDGFLVEQSIGGSDHLIRTCEFRVWGYSRVELTARVADDVCGHIWKALGWVDLYYSDKWFEEKTQSRLPSGTISKNSGRPMSTMEITDSEQLSARYRSGFLSEVLAFLDGTSDRCVATSESIFGCTNSVMRGQWTVEGLQCQFKKPYNLTDERLDQMTCSTTREVTLQAEWPFISDRTYGTTIKHHGLAEF